MTPEVNSQHELYMFTQAYMPGMDSTENKESKESEKISPAEMQEEILQKLDSKKSSDQESKPIS